MCSRLPDLARSPSCLSLSTHTQPQLIVQTRDERARSARQTGPKTVAASNSQWTTLQIGITEVISSAFVSSARTGCAILDTDRVIQSFQWRNPILKTLAFPWPDLHRIENRRVTWEQRQKTTHCIVAVSDAIAQATRQELEVRSRKMEGQIANTLLDSSGSLYYAKKNARRIRQLIACLSDDRWRDSRKIILISDDAVPGFWSHEG